MASVSGATVTFTPALVYGHYAGVYAGMEMRGEVARLTRNILVRGDLSAATTTSRFGAHMMFANDFTEVRLSGVEVTRSGQAGVLGRYPVHFHFANDVATRAFVKDVSVHHNYQRCYTVHHTNSLLMQRNIGFATYGHCFFLEDGIETGNKFLYNLALIAEKPEPNQMIIPSDSQPTIFWITNPNNTWIGNVVAGAFENGYWFALPVNPTGPSKTDTMCPRRTPLGVFAHNSIHSASGNGVHVDDAPDANGVVGGSALDFVWRDPGGNNYWSLPTGYHPMANPTALDKPDVPQEAVFESFSAWRNMFRGVWTRNGKVRWRHLRSADNGVGITFATNLLSATLEESLFIGRTNNMGNPSAGSSTLLDGSTAPMWGDPTYPIRGYEMYDGPNYAVNIKCVNFKQDSLRKPACVQQRYHNSAILDSRSTIEKLDASDGSIPVDLSNLAHDGDRSAVLIDADGTLSGRPPANGMSVTAVNPMPFMRTPSCVDAPGGGAVFCPSHIRQLVFQFDSGTPASVPAPSAPAMIKLTRGDLPATSFYPLCGGGCATPDGGNLGTDSTYFTSVVPLWKVRCLPHTHTHTQRCTYASAYTNALSHALLQSVSYQHTLTAIRTSLPSSRRRRRRASTSDSTAPPAFTSTPPRRSERRSSLLSAIRPPPQSRR